MARKSYEAEATISKLRLADVLHGQGMSMSAASQQLGVGEVTFSRLRMAVG